MSTANTGGLDRVLDQIQRFAHPDPVPLLVRWRQIIETDTKRGVLAGTDGFGQPMKAVTYRPKKGAERKWTGRDTGALKRRSAHTGDFAETSYNNLTPREYRTLTGPPLAPRGAGSRVYTNIETEHGYDPSRGVYYALGGWRDVVSRKGKPFLIAHFTGYGRLLVRDLRGIRPQGQGECLDELEKWGVAHCKACFI